MKMHRGKKRYSRLEPGGIRVGVAGGMGAAGGGMNSKYTSSCSNVSERQITMDGTESHQLAVSHTNQVQLGTIMAAHYMASRASVDDWLRRRDQYLMLYITGAWTIIGVYLSKPEIFRILYLVPALTIVILLAYLSADLHIAYLCRWLRVEYTSLLEKWVQTYGVISLAPWHWDNSNSLHLFYSSVVGRLRYIFFSLTILLINSATALATTHSTESSRCLFVICVVISLLSCGILLIVYRNRKAMIQEQG